MNRLKTLSLMLLLFLGRSLANAQFRQVDAVADANKNGFSDLWGVDGDKWNPAGGLPDVSFCGFNMGYTDTPTYPTKAILGENGAKANDNIDDATELQNLINTVALPATIKIPAGVWNIEKRIYLNRSGVLLVGENGAEFKMNKTLRQIDNDLTTSDRYAFSDGFFIIGAQISLQPYRQITADAAHGGKDIVVEAGVTYLPETLINIIQTDDAAESLFQYVTGSSEKRAFWNLNNQYNNDPILYLQNLFQLKAKVVKQVGNVVTLDRTLPLDIKTKWNPRVAMINMNATLQNCGIENVKIRMNGLPYPGHFNSNGSNAIWLNKALNCWVKNVECIDVDLGVVLNEAYYCTFDAIAMNVSLRNKSSDTGHHAFWCNERSSDNLFSNLTINTTFIHDISVEGVANGNVFSKCVGDNINLDHHRGAPYSNVFTEMNLGRGTRIFGSSGSWYRGPHTGIYSTVWNVTRNTGTFGALPSSSNTGGLGKVSKDWYYLNSIGVRGSRIANLDEHRNQYVEFANGEQLKTPNIFLAQRQKRFANTPGIPTSIAPNNNVVKELLPYPNPSSSGIFYVKKAKNWKVYNLSGSKVLEGKGDNIDLSGFANGIYNLQTESAIHKLIYQ